MKKLKEASVEEIKEAGVPLNVAEEVHKHITAFNEKAKIPSKMILNTILNANNFDVIGVLLHKNCY